MLELSLKEDTQRGEDGQMIQIRQSAIEAQRQELAPLRRPREEERGWQGLEAWEPHGAMEGLDQNVTG